jgi:hypothetical protein
MGNKSEWFIIDDIEKFIESTRVLVFNSFGKTNETELDDLSFLLSDLPKEEVEELNSSLSQEECMIIAKEFIRKEQNKKTLSTRFTISNKRYMGMVESFNSRLISNMLNHLVNKGLLDTAYDADSNDFVFWVKEESENRETD